MKALDGTIAWITGGGSGIGLAAATAFGRLGATVVISGRNLATLESAAALLASRDLRVECAALDVSDQAACARVGAEILRRHGRIDILVNSAGFNIARRNWQEVDAAGWDDVYAANVHGTFYCIAAVLPAMRAQGGGRIVNVASWAGRFDSRMAGPAYMSAKHAVTAMTRSLNMDEWKHGIRATSLCPGEVATPIMGKRAVVPTPEQLADMIQVQDVEDVFTFLAQVPPRVCVNELVLSPTRNGAFR
jgi:NAD(P)-dependent dehydrogenase (short-subunit alcohol dehydrogenase family)